MERLFWNSFGINVTTDEVFGRDDSGNNVEDVREFEKSLIITYSRDPTDPKEHKGFVNAEGRS